MKDQAFIKSCYDSTDTFTDLDKYGVTLTRGWREALLTPPSVKDYLSNDNRLEHGVNVLAKPECCKMSKRDVSISFFLEGKDEDDYLEKLNSFLDKIAYSGEFYLKVPKLKTIYKLVYSSCSKYGDYGVKKSNFTLKLTENNPAERTKL